jgi:hypothetical protein
MLLMLCPLLLEQLGQLLQHQLQHHHCCLLRRQRFFLDTELLGPVPPHATVSDHPKMDRSLLFSFKNQAWSGLKAVE